MHCCLGIWFKKKWTQLFNTCSYQHWQRLLTEPQLPISARVCLGHYGGRWKHLATPLPPHRRSSVCFPGEADFPSAALCYVLIPKPQDKTTVAFSCIWFFFLIAKSEQLRTTEIYSFIFLDSMGPESWRLWSHAASSYFREDSVPVFTSLRWLWELIGSWQRHSNFSLCRPAAPSLPLSVSPCLLLVLEHRLSHQDS